MSFRLNDCCIVVTNNEGSGILVGVRRSYLRARRDRLCFPRYVCSPINFLRGRRFYDCRPIMCRSVSFGWGGDMGGGHNALIMHNVWGGRVAVFKFLNFLLVVFLLVIFVNFAVLNGVLHMLFKVNGRPPCRGQASARRGRGACTRARAGSRGRGFTRFSSSSSGERSRSSKGEGGVFSSSRKRCMSCRRIGWRLSFFLGRVFRRSNAFVNRCSFRRSHL